MNTRLFILIFVLTAVAMSAESDELKHLQALHNSDYFVMETEKQGGGTQRYHMYVRVPDDMPDGQTIPTVYLLDGGINFPLFVSYYRYLRLMEELPELIIVGISYGTDDWRKGNNRGHDFTLPSDKAEHYGGAEKFERWLQDLLTKIERDYPADPTRHILYGQSLGGQFGLYTAMYGTAPLFGVIAANPALHNNLNAFTQDLTRLRPPLTYIAAADNDAERFKRPFEQWREHWQSSTPCWKNHIQEYANHNHLSLVPAALRDGLKWILSKEKTEQCEAGTTRP